MNQTKRSLPFFISFEGGEGAGKTTVIQKIEHSLINSGYTIVRTREPGGSPLGEHIRHLLLDRKETISISAMAELMLFLAARSQQIEEVIKPALNSGKMVLCDRFNDSTVAYQGAGRGLGVERVEKLCDLVCGSIVPHLTLYLDVDPKVGLMRTTSTAKENAQAGHVDRIEAESLDFHARLREAYLSIAKRNPERFLIIDANQLPETVFEKAINIIYDQIKKHV